MRLEGHLKMGYYPTPPDVTARLRRLVRFPEEPFSAFDPCAGEGVALAELVKGSGAVAYGIELDQHRSSRAKSRLDNTIRGDFFRSKLTQRSVSLLLLNPPYATDSEDGRLELSFLKAAHPLLKPGGVLIYIVPQARLTARVARLLAAHFEDIQVYRFPKGEYERFGQIVVLGARRERASRDGVPDALRDVPEKKLRTLPARAKAVYDIPPSPERPASRRGRSTLRRSRRSSRPRRLAGPRSARRITAATVRPSRSTLATWRCFSRRGSSTGSSARVRTATSYGATSRRRPTRARTRTRRATRPSAKPSASRSRSRRCRGTGRYGCCRGGRCRDCARRTRRSFLPENRQCGIGQRSCLRLHQPVKFCGPALSEHV